MAPDEILIVDDRIHKINRYPKVTESHHLYVTTMDPPRAYTMTDVKLTYTLENPMNPTYHDCYYSSPSPWANQLTGIPPLAYRKRSGKSKWKKSRRRG